MKLKGPCLSCSLSLSCASLSRSDGHRARPSRRLRRRRRRSSLRPRAAPSARLLLRVRRRRKEARAEHARIARQLHASRH
eukprot:4382533-Pleurochrysis_carterae.AAC.2